MTPLHKQLLHTLAGATNMGYPWLVLPLVVYNTALLHSMNWLIIIKATNMGYPWLALLLPLRTNVPPLSKRALMTVKQMVNVGYPWLAIPLMTNMLVLVTPLRDDITSETHPLPHSHTADNTVPADTVSNAQIAAQEPIQAERTPSYPDDDDNGIHSRPAAFREPKTAVHPSTKTTNNPPESNRDCLHPPLDDSDNVLNRPAGRDKDASPPKRIKYSEVHPYAIISLFDGVGSAIPAITKAFGCAPRIVIAAECDPILRQIVGEQFLFRTDGKRTQSSKDTFTIYADDVRQLLKDRCRIFKEAFALAGPQCRWFVIAGSPCQDLTPAGPPERPSWTYWPLQLPFLLCPCHFMAVTNELSNRADPFSTGKCWHNA